jgi:hypothetical protein
MHEDFDKAGSIPPGVEASVPDIPVYGGRFPEGHVHFRRAPSSLYVMGLLSYARQIAIVSADSERGAILSHGGWRTLS